MPMVTTFKKSDVRARCDQCGTVFDPVHGAVCESCRRLLCGKHAYGSLGRRILSFVPGTALVCPECRHARRTGGQLPAPPGRREW